MARVFRRTYRDKRTGGQKQASRWYVEFYDQKHDLTRRLPGYTDRKACEQLGRHLETLSACAASRREPDTPLRQWLEAIPVAMRDRLLGFGLIDGKRAAAAKPLLQHIDDYEADLLAQGATPKHAKQTAGRLRTVIDEAGFTYWSDISRSKVQTAIDRVRHHGKPLKSQTRNHYVAAVKAFCSWMTNDGRAEVSPVAGKKLRKQTVTDATERRAATVNEMRRLIAVAKAGPDYCWGGGKGAKRQPHRITGHERAIVYRLAIATGLRADEIIREIEL